MPIVLNLINKYFPQETAFNNPFELDYQSAQVPQGFNSKVVPEGGWEKGAVGRLIHTRVGDGPRKLDDKESLLGEDGMPKTLN